MIGIIVADKHELNKFEFRLIETKTINQFEFNVFEINSKKVVVVHSGIGLVNAAAATQELISSYKVSQIYSYGAVGGDETTEVYEIVIPEKIFFHDVKTPWYKRGQTPGEKEFFVNAEKNTSSKNLASGGSFLASKDLIEEVKKELNVAIFDMETAAIAQITDKNNVSLHVIKCVSDIIGKDSSNLESINDRITNAGKKAFDEMLKRI